METGDQGASSSLFNFGVISDVQYADHDDIQPPFAHTRKRFYRQSLEHLNQAVEEFKHAGSNFILQLGDIIDGKSKKEAETALETVLQVFSKHGVIVHHALGNHELYNFTHQQAISHLIDHSNGQSSGVGYYSFTSHHYRFICIDCYDVAILGRSPGESSYSLAKEYLSVNPNADLNDPTGMEGEERRFVGFSGGVGKVQLAWLANELKTAQEGKQNVVVYGHCGILPDATMPHCLLWNYKEVLTLLEQCPAVVVVFSGHSHRYRHIVSPTGKYYFALRGVIETPADEKAWALVTVHQACIRIKVYDGEAMEELIIPTT